MWHMTVVKINAITVPADSGDELARRFAARAGAVDDHQEGFEGFELLKPTDERTTWLVVTRWRDEAAFQAWLHSPAFGHGHRSAAGRSDGAAPPPVGVSSELWSHEIAGGSAASRTDTRPPHEVSGMSGSTLPQRTRPSMRGLRVPSEGMPY
jgi:heme-degrading monooxygenase HmoA